MVKYKCGTHSSMEGEWYEIRVAMLLFLRCKRNANVTQFQLATNATAGGQKLDDVFLRYKTKDSPDAWRTYFLQLKKRGKGTLVDASLTEASGSFSLKTYVDSFLHIKRGMSADDREEILNGSFEDCQFVIYTNVPAKRDILKRVERGSLGELGALLLDPKEAGTVLGFEKGRDKDIFAALEGMGAEGYVEKVKVLAGQPTPDRLATMIKEELKLRDDMPEGYLNMMYDSLQNLFKDWWNARGDDNKMKDSIDDTSDIYDLALVVVRSHFVGILSSQEMKRLCFDVRLRDPVTWTDEGESSAMLHVIATEPSLRSTCTKLIQSHRRFPPGSFAFFGLQCLEREQDTILPVWRSNEYPRWLVVLSKSSSSDHHKLGDKICEVLLANRKKRIVVVSQSGDSFTSYLKGKLRDDSKSYKEIEDDCRVSQLDKETLDMLRVVPVLFQSMGGVAVAAGSFLSDIQSLKGHSRPNVAAPLGLVANLGVNLVVLGTSTKLNRWLKF